ncbi:MAG: hypothetical protein R2745_16305 [Vicinamibacterales bacterium]
MAKATAAMKPRNARRHGLGQERRGHVAAGVDGADGVLPDEHHGPEAQDEREQVEDPDGGRGVGD